MRYLLLRYPQLLLLIIVQRVGGLSAHVLPPVTSATATAGTSSTTPPIIRVPWLIVGGGIHGVHVATRLLGEGVTDNLCIIDDAELLLSKWKTRTAATGMEYLRSSAGYHLDLSEDSLRRFGTTKNKIKTTTKSKADSLLFAKDYERPRLDLFNQHCDAIIQKYQLDEKHIQGMVTKVEPHDDHVRVQVRCNLGSTENVEVLAEHVVLALGNDQPLYPEWVTQDLVKSGMVQHLLDTAETDTTQALLRSDNANNSSVVAIIGGGITAGHKALQLAQQQQPNGDKKTAFTVHLISRHAIMEQQFDTHQDWMMDRAAAKRSQAGGGAGLPLCQQEFQSTTCWQERRRIIARERVPGTVTAAVNRGQQGLQYAIRQNQVQWHQAQVTSVSVTSASHDMNNDKTAKKCTLSLSTGETLEVDQILLATGFGKRPPSFLSQFHNNNLPVSDFCGYPIVDPTLRWGHPRIFVTGALAELELGPSARNIAGARLAAERIIQAIKKQT